LKTFSQIKNKLRNLVLFVCNPINSVLLKLKKEDCRFKAWETGRKKTQSPKQTKNDNKKPPYSNILIGEIIEEIC
jgi:hypothetical protein